MIIFLSFACLVHPETKRRRGQEGIISSVFQRFIVSMNPEYSPLEIFHFEITNSFNSTLFIHIQAVLSHS